MQSANQKKNLSVSLPSRGLYATNLEHYDPKVDRLGPRGATRFPRICFPANTYPGKKEAQTTTEETEKENGIGWDLQIEISKTMKKYGEDRSNTGQQDSLFLDRMGIEKQTYEANPGDEYSGPE